MTSPVRVPADVDREDRLIGDLTARQLAILATAGAALYGVWMLLFRVLPAWSPAWAQTAPVLRGLVFTALAVPAGVAGLALALGRRDGMPLDRLLVAAARQRLATPTLHPHHALAPSESALDTHKTLEAEPGSRTGRRRRDGAGRVVVPWVPARAVRGSRVSREAGLVDLGRYGLALLCAVSPISLTLRSPAEQDQLVAGMSRWLHSLTCNVQILVRTTPLDLTGHVDHLRTDADALPHPALAAAAHAHADHLTDLAQHTDLLHRRIYLVFHEPSPPTAHQGGGGDGGQAPRTRVRRAVRAAEEQLLRRAEEADHLLGALGLRVTPLDPHTTARTLHAATHPDHHLTPHLPTPPAPARLPVPPPGPPNLRPIDQPSWSWPPPPSEPGDQPRDAHLINRAAPRGHARHSGTARGATRSGAAPVAVTRDGWRSASDRETSDIDTDADTADLYDLADLAAVTGDDGGEPDDQQLEDHNLHAVHPIRPAATAGRPGERDSEALPWSWAPGAKGYLG
ncbi:PrgI family protein [Pseudonocardia adelaidensis]|uniref:PrgI family protein n=1 Tax=Pseudonocardia adelaidensis TaxID=648754 RepID=A0ABP9P768_9PSEU